MNGTDRRACWLAGCAIIGIAASGCAVTQTARSYSRRAKPESNLAAIPPTREFVARGPRSVESRRIESPEPPWSEPSEVRLASRTNAIARDRLVAESVEQHNDDPLDVESLFDDEPPFDRGRKSEVKLASVQEAQDTPPAPDNNDEPARLPNRIRSASDHPIELPPAMAIDLASALQRIGGQNPQVQLARARIAEACAQQNRAEALWLPSIRAGANWNKHEGRIQDVRGNVFDTSRGSYYTGFGANAVGAGSPAVPGVVANFHLADAIHQPAAAEHATAARQFGANATEQDVILQTSLAYLELLRAHQEMAIAREIEQHARELTELTKSYADTGQGLRADHDRARTELSVRRNDTMRASETTQVASARLATLLRLDPATPLQPAESVVAAWSLTDSEAPVRQLIADGLSHRSEVCESRSLVAEACQRLRREKQAPLLPSVLLAASYGGFSGGTGSTLPSTKDRLDADVVAYWELRNLGFGERAARAEAASRVQQAKWREVAMLDRIAREVVEAYVQVTARQQQVAIAEEGIEAAQNSFDRNVERIQNAQGLPLESLQSLQALAQAKREYLRVLCDYNTAQLQLQRSVGWDHGAGFQTAGQTAN